jgi:fused signal recognition particle receptor
MITLFGPPEPTLLERLKESVSKSRSQLAEQVETLFAGERAIDPGLLKELESALLAADLGVRTTREVLDAVRQKVDRRALTDAKQLKAELKNLLAGIFSGVPAGKNGQPDATPRVVFIVGVNGSG